MDTKPTPPKFVLLVSPAAPNATQIVRMCGRVYALRYVGGQPVVREIRAAENIGAKVVNRHKGRPHASDLD